MKKQAGLWSRFAQYVKALDRIGQLLYVLGLLPTVIDLAARLAGINLSIPPWVFAIWAILAVGYANFRIFEASSGMELEFRIYDQSVSLEKWLYTKDDQPSLYPEIVVGFSTRLEIYNHSQKPTHVKLDIVLVESDWGLIPNTPITNLKIAVKRPSAQREIQSANPFTLAPAEIDSNVRISGQIPFALPDTANGFRYFGSLSKFTITFSAEQAGHKMILLPIEYNTATIRKSIEKTLVDMVTHNGNLAPQIVQMLKEYWNVEAKDDIAKHATSK